MDIQGTIKEVFATQTISEKFKKREFVLTTDGSTPYPQHISFQVTKDNCDKLNSYSTGDEVSVHFNLKGREWSGPNGVKYFNTLEAWKITGVSQFLAGGTGVSTNNDKPVNVQAENHAIANNDGMDLPF
jgi:hypothetical protein